MNEAEVCIFLWYQLTLVQSDDSGLDVDSNYNSEPESVNSSNYKYVERGIRRFYSHSFVFDFLTIVDRYHRTNNSTYYFPSDEIEAIRLDAMQFLFRNLYGGRNVLIPVLENPTFIMDVGTGSGGDSLFGHVLTKRSLGY